MSYQWNWEVKKRAANLGSGQRRFNSIPGEIGWVNLDCISRDGQVPDLIHNILEPLPFEDASLDHVVLSQVYEHFHLSEGRPVLKECYRVLRKGGTLWITVPDVRALVQRWMTRQISDYIFMVNMYGAYQGEPGDDHHWGWSFESLSSEVMNAGQWSEIGRVSSCDVPGSDLAFDWWVLGVRAVK